MRRLIIIGAGGFGHETLEWLLTLPPDRRDWDEVAGFLDHDAEAFAGYQGPQRILGSPAHYQPTAADRFVCTIGAPGVRSSICNDLQNRGAIFASAIHPLADISRHARLGRGCIVSPYSCIGHNVEIGNHSFVLAHVVVAHDSRVGSACNISPGAKISGGCQIGDRVMIGTNASLLPKSRIGDDATVGAGSVVLRKVASGTTVFGNPAKQIGKFR